MMRKVSLDRLYIIVRMSKKTSSWWNRFRKKMGDPKLLCDTCEYDYPSACHNSKRPNATDCPDYKRRRV
jgi:hypothetical protein